MADRREIITAIALASDSHTMSDLMWDAAYCLRGTTVKEEPLDSTPKKMAIYAIRMVAHAKWIGDRQKVLYDHSGLTGHIDSGIAVFEGARIPLVSDIALQKTVHDSVTGTITVAATEQELYQIGDYLDAEYHTKTAFDSDWRANPVYTMEMKIANIAHDLLDAMSYELRGINSYNGQPHGYSFDHIMKHLNNRLRTFATYQKDMSSGLEKTHFANMGQYILDRVVGAKDSDGFPAIADYIDANVPKLIIPRRHWSL